MILESESTNQNNTKGEAPTPEKGIIYLIFNHQGHMRDFVYYVFDGKIKLYLFFFYEGKHEAESGWW